MELSLEFGGGEQRGLFPETLPQTLALLSRAVQIHLNHLVTEEDLRDIEAAINKVAFYLL